MKYPSLFEVAPVCYTLSCRLIKHEWILLAHVAVICSYGKSQHIILSCKNFGSDYTFELSCKELIKQLAAKLSILFSPWHTIWAVRSINVPRTLEMVEMREMVISEGLKRRLLYLLEVKSG
jgi:hypothetical protein